jgi:HKD family nuclease
VKTNLSSVVRRTLVGDGDAFVAGLPSDFVLRDVLKKAKKIQLATAFAHRSGWQHLRQGVTQGTGIVSLLTGLENCQTEPALLKDWIQLQSKEPKRIEGKLASTETFFHPKVLIVSCAGQHASFAIVGSGNLSYGGIQGNTECCVYLEDAGLLSQLASWFKSEFDRASPLNETAIKEYEPYYERNRKRRKKLQEEQRSAQNKVRSSVWDSEKALREAKKYFQGPHFKASYASRQRGAAEIRTALRSPKFTFDKAGFKEFFKIGAFGWLSSINREKMFRRANRIRSGLKMLVADGETKLASVLNKGGKFYVPGFSLNAVSKALAAHDPKTWPLFNERVRRALDDFGYPKPRGSSKAEQYLAYKHAMEKFKQKCKEDGCGELDALALDSFFLHYSAYLDKKYGKRRSRKARKVKVRRT